MMIWYSMKDFSHNNLLQCLEFALKIANDPRVKKAIGAEKAKAIDDIKKEITPERINFIKFLEKEFVCSGICEPSLFFITRDLDLGRPT